MAMASKTDTDIQRFICNLFNGRSPKCSMKAVSYVEASSPSFKLG